MTQPCASVEQAFVVRSQDVVLQNALALAACNTISNAKRLMIKSLEAPRERRRNDVMVESRLVGWEIVMAVPRSFSRMH